MPSFDVVSEPEMHEVQNALDQAQREIKQRYDFRGTDASLERSGDGFKLGANSEERVKAVHEVLIDKFVKRKLSLKFLDAKDPQPAGGQMWTQQVLLKKGVDKDNARKIVEAIKKDKSLKVTPAIQGDAVRVTGKKKDDLQVVIQKLRQMDADDELDVHVTFDNFRD